MRIAGRTSCAPTGRYRWMSHVRCPTKVNAYENCMYCQGLEAARAGGSAIARLVCDHILESFLLISAFSGYGKGESHQTVCCHHFERGARPCGRRCSRSIRIRSPPRMRQRIRQPCGRTTSRCAALSVESVRTGCTASDSVTTINMTVHAPLTELMPVGDESREGV